MTLFVVGSSSSVPGHTEVTELSKLSLDLDPLLFYLEDAVSIVSGTKGREQGNILEKFTHT